MSLNLRAELTVSVTALVLSVVATVSSIYFAYTTLKTDILPVLVFQYSTDEGWSLRNVGDGPALNVVVAHQLREDPAWQKPTRLYPIPEGETVPTTWFGHNPEKLVATYEDVHNRRYTSVTDDDLTVIKHDLQDGVSWEASEILRVWEHDSAKEARSRRTVGEVGDRPGKASSPRSLEELLTRNIKTFTIPWNARVDFDTGRINMTALADVEIAEHYIKPLNQTRIAVVGQRPDTRDECALSQLSAQSVPLHGLWPGTSFCLVTNQQRYVTFRLSRSAARDSFVVDYAMLD